MSRRAVWVQDDELRARRWRAAVEGKRDVVGVHLLPSEVIHNVLRFCSPRDVAALAQTNSVMRTEVEHWLHEEAARRFGADDCVENGLLGALKVQIRRGLDISRMDYAVDWDAFGTKTTSGSLLHLAIYCDNLDALHVLLVSGADPNARDTAGLTPLHTAVRWRRNCFARQLVLSGANVHIKNSDGVSPLHYAAATGTLELTRTLLKLGADPNELDLEQNTPLHTASTEDVAMELINGGADLDRRNVYGIKCIECLSPQMRRHLQQDMIFSDSASGVISVDFDIQCL